MNRLWVRLTLAFVLVTLLTVAIVAGATSWLADRQFRGYLSRPDVISGGGLLPALQGYYEQYGSWEGVDRAIARQRPRPGSPGNSQGGFRGPPLLVADVNGRIIYDDRHNREGDVLPADELQRAQPISATGQTVGYVLAGSTDFEIVSPSERAFLDQLRNSVLIAGVAALALGVGLGLLISRSLAKPLGKLAQAAHAFAARDWSKRVPLADTAHIAELSEVAVAFNNMADSLNESETLRRNLMADVAHELRTPLTVIQGLLRALIDGVHPLHMKEVVTVYDETRLLSRLVEDVRELALAESRQLPLMMRAVDVSALLQATANRFAAAADAQQIALSVDAPSSLPKVQADPDRAAQVLHNLVTNAFRHTPSGGTVTLSAAAQGARVRISVADTGEGIPAADVPMVFERFYRGDKSRARGTGGTGLGLTIARQLVEMMGGQIGVESAHGQGSRFWFTLSE